MIIRAFITVLCGIGLYVAIFMLQKTRRSERGLLREPSVVDSPRARLFGGLPNAQIGVLYYPAFLVGIWVAHRPWELGVLLIVSALVGVVSVVLAYSLLFVTRMPCPYCWTAHAINWMLVVANAALIFR